MSTNAPIASVVIPAHDEESVIGRTLSDLVRGSSAGDLDIVVVANACRDDTAAVAAAHGVRVVETPLGGKARALRLGDAQCVTFPRIYLDADVSLTFDDARSLVAALDDPAMLAAAPTPAWNLDGASVLARRINKVHCELMAPSRRLAGVGVYALSARAHARVFPIPDVIADDEWVNRSFTNNECVAVAGARSVVRPARTVRAHLARRVRVRTGNRQLDALGKPAPHGRLTMRSLNRLVIRRAVSPIDALCYLVVLAADRVSTRTSGRVEAVWSVDVSSR